MLWSHWSIATCLLRNLKIFLCVFDRFLEIAEIFVADANIAIRIALARFVACKNEIFNG